LAEFVLSTCGESVLLLGLTFKDNTDDLRESPLVDLARSLVAAGRDLTIVDSHVNLESLRTQFSDLAPYLAPAMRTLPKSGLPVSVVVSKALALPDGLKAREVVDLSFAGSEIQGEVYHRWVMG
jgi:GDP-mannose 6-dehydrogenase